MTTKIENGQNVVIENRDYMGKLQAPVYGTLQSINSNGTCIIELADGTTVYADHPKVESVAVYEKIVAERANRKPVVVVANGLASDDGQAYDEYER